MIRFRCPAAASSSPSRTPPNISRSSPRPNNGPTMMARIGVMRALNRHVERVFNPDRKDKHWGKRKLKRDEKWKGGSNGHSGLGDFCDRDALNRAGGGTDVRSGLSGLPARVPGRLLRMPLYVAASVQRVGIGPLGTVR